MSRLHTAIFAASLALAFSAQGVANDKPRPAKGTAELQYRLVEIPYVSPDGREGETRAVSINDRGDVLAVGTDRTQTTPTGIPLENYFIWRRGRVVAELNTPDPAYPYLTALGINNRSEVVGAIATTDPGSAFGGFRGFVWRRGHFTVLGPLPSTGGNTVGVAMNDWGEVAGYSQDSDVDIFLTAFRWYRGRFVELPNPAANSAGAVDINNRGQVVGTISRDGLGLLFDGYVWSRKGSVHFLDSLSGVRGMAPRAINDRGQIVGTAVYPDSSLNRAFLWEDGTVLDLGTLPGAIDSNAQAINVFGTVVGYVTPASGGIVAMVWRDGQMHDLNEMIADDDPLRSRVHLSYASDINNFGWIAANGIDPNSTSVPKQAHGYLLIPIWKHRR